MWNFSQGPLPLKSLPYHRCHFLISTCSQQWPPIFQDNSVLSKGIGFPLQALPASWSQAMFSNIPEWWVLFEWAVSPLGCDGLPFTDSAVLSHCLGTQLYFFNFWIYDCFWIAKAFDGWLIRKPLLSIPVLVARLFSPDHIVLSLSCMKVRRPPTNSRCHWIGFRGHFRKVGPQAPGCSRAPRVRAPRWRHSKVAGSARGVTSRGRAGLPWGHLVGAARPNPQCRHGRGRGQSVSAKPNQNKPETRLFPPARERLACAPSPRRPRGCEPRVAARRLQEAGEGAAAGMARRGPRG